MSGQTITYFEGEGRQHLAGTIKAVMRRLKGDTAIRKIVVFTAEGEGALALAKAAKGLGVQVIAATFPFGQAFKADTDGEDAVVTGIVDQSARASLKRAGVSIVQGTLPFQDILIPQASDPKIQTIIHTLRLFGGGTVFCVQAAIMACDSGAVTPGEEIIAMAADTALIIRAARKWTMFHPVEGLDIEEVICKPRSFTVTRQRPGETTATENTAASRH